MSKDEIGDLALSLLAEGILGASADEIMQVAVANGVNVEALERKVRGLIAARLDGGAGSTTRDFAIGDTVALRSDPGRIGVVTAAIRSNRETRYSVFVGDRLQTLYASQLTSAQIAPSITEASLAELGARLTALQLTAPSLANLYSLQAGRVDFIPHQFRPVLKFIRADRPRLLIADEVGVGKTIEAGLLLREMQARRPLRSVLVVCSKALVVEEKWHREMRRFDEDFVSLSSADLRYCIEQTDLDGEWPERFSRAILPFSLVNENLIDGYLRADGSRTRGLSGLDAPPRFDLLIVDEAHNARNPDTALHRGLRILADNAEAVILMTATPVQMGSGDLYSLLNLLRPDLVIDRPTFERMAEPNPEINAAAACVRQGAAGWQRVATDGLSSAAATPWGRAMLAPSPDYQAVLRAIDTAEGDGDRVRLIQEVEGLHSFARLISRTRRRDIGNFTTRKPTTVPVPFTPGQQSLHDALLELQRGIYRRTHGTGPLGFLMTTIRRQASSSLHGLVPFLATILNRRLSELERVEADANGNDDFGHAVDEVRAEVEELLERARHLPPADPKLERLLEIVREKAGRTNRRLLVFSAFRHTLAYLADALRTHGVRVGTIHGDVADDERRLLRRAFALDPQDSNAVDVLLSSEVGSEGLDFQFCDALMNYDIPWNPMRIEQRIGRIDRYGQASETVAIYNLVTPGTVDFDIYNRCLLRIGIFERSIGGSEAILGEVAKGIQRVADDFSLNDDERGERLQQLADNEIRHIRETELLEDREAELFGIRVARQRMDDDIAESSSIWLEPAALERLVGMHLERTLDLGRNPMSGQGAVKSLRLSVEGRRRLLPQKARAARQTIAEREWDAWLRGGHATLALTFDREAANRDRSLAFITPVHPLTQAAARAAAGDEEVRVAIRASVSGLPPGVYPFAIYQWQLSGLREDAMLVPVVADHDIETRFNEILAAGRDMPGLTFPDPAAFDALDGWHHERWEARLAEHVAHTGRVARFRRDSLDASHRARLAMLGEQLADAREGKIRRMRTAQIARAETEYVETVARLERDGGRADVLSRRLAVGILQLEA